MSNKKLEVLVEDALFLIENHINSSKTILNFDIKKCLTLNNEQQFRFFCLGGKCEIQLLLATNELYEGILSIDDIEVAIDGNTMLYNCGLQRGEHTIKLFSTNAIWGGLLRISVFGGKKIE